MRKNNKYQIDIEEWNWKQIKLLQEGQKQKLEIKRIRAKVEILKKGPTYNFWGKREKQNKGHKFDDLSHEPLVDPIYCHLSFFKKDTILKFFKAFDLFGIIFHNMFLFGFYKINLFWFFYRVITSYNLNCGFDSLTQIDLIGYCPNIILK
jgi:hypothetical protein